MRPAWLVLLAGWLAGCTAVPTAPVPRGEATLYVVARGWHTDIGIAVPEVTGPLARLEAGTPDIRFMVFGFGERVYYMAGEANSGDMLAALLPSRSAILMTALRSPPDAAFAEQRVVTLQLPRSTVERIGALLWDSLEKAGDGAAIRLGDGPYPGSVFYAGRETYSAFYTCNTWTARVLRDAGLPIDPAGVLFVGQVMDQVASLAAAQPPPE